MFEFFSTKGFKAYVKKARKILDGNWTGRYTRPSPDLYPHQWNWDSGFIAIGYAHYRTQRAMQELGFLFKHQWDNGMVPQIVFNKAVLGNYFPEPDFWKVPGGRLTSGITMPPLHAIACLHIYQHGKARGGLRDFLQEMFPKLKASHRYLYRHRDPERTGLVYIRHPWESGLDNSPSWDEPLRAIEIDKESLPRYERRDLQHGVPAEQRPSNRDYDRYVFLVDLFRRASYDEKAIYAECPFLVQDVLFNSILCRANHDLIEIGKVLGEDTKEIEEWLDSTSRAIRQRMWSPERKQFDPIDLAARKRLPTPTASSFMPLFSVAADTQQAQDLYHRLNSHSFCALHQGNCFTIPNFDMSHQDFDSKNYWRGPVWININWMLAQGLKNYGYQAKSDSMKKDMIQLPVRFGFHEYFDSITGKGYGSAAFSWTAALFIDLVEEYYDKDQRKLRWFHSAEERRLKSPVLLNRLPGRSSSEFSDPASRLMSCIGDLKDKFYDVDRGLVDYQAMKLSEEYRSYLELVGELKGFDLKSLKSEEERLAFWINLYNAIVVHGIVELGIRSTVWEVSNFFSHIQYVIGGYPFSPDDIEHGILRSNARPPYRVFSAFKRKDPRREFALKRLDPRIHFSLVCGSRSCAPIRFYEASSIHEQLESATRNFVNSSEVVILPEENKILLSQIFHWYAKDFGKRPERFRFILRYLDPTQEARYLAEHVEEIEVEYLFYDWNLNH